MYDESLRRHLPHGLSDLFFESAAAKTQVEDTLQRTFLQWGYGRIVLPMYGFWESVATGASTELKEQMYRFFDRDGHSLALRPDMTVPTARVVGTRLFDQSLPMRFFYIGSVFRHVEPQAGRHREFTQAGVELIGSETPEADAEVVGLAVAALKALGISNFQINLGQVAFLRAILRDTYLTGDELSTLEQSISRRNDVELSRTLTRLGITGNLAEAISTLPQLTGDASVIANAMRLATNDPAERAIKHLSKVYSLLNVQGAAEHVILDLGEVRSMAYYSGITFHGYVEGLGSHVCRGGRYDGLIRQFGPDLPAVGFALGVERAMLVAEPQVRIAPDLLVGNPGSPEVQRVCAAARDLGLRVEADVMGLSPDRLVEYGEEREIVRVLYLRKDGSLAMVHDHVTKSFPVDELLEEMRSWTH